MVAYKLAQLWRYYAVQNGWVIYSHTNRKVLKVLRSGLRSNTLEVYTSLMGSQFHNFSILQFCRVSKCNWWCKCQIGGQDIFRKFLSIYAIYTVLLYYTSLQWLIFNVECSPHRKSAPVILPVDRKVWTNSAFPLTLEPGLATSCLYMSRNRFRRKAQTSSTFWKPPIKHLNRKVNDIVDPSYTRVVLTHHWIKQTICY